MRGLLEVVLTRCYGEPMVVKNAGYVEHRWCADDEKRRSVLFSESVPAQANREVGPCREIYGDHIGGFLVGNSLKVATRGSHEVFGLYTIAELQRQPEVQAALVQDSAVCFFMDAANVWYYGCCDAHLFVYDAETGELDDLGEIQHALKELIRQWEAA